MNDESRKQKGKLKDGVILPQAVALSSLPDIYPEFIADIKQRIRHQRIKTLLHANSEMTMLYWHIGSAVLQKQETEGWGAKVIDRMAYDLKNEFPDMSGFSPRNIKYMRAFAQAWPDVELVQRTVALIPWRSNIVGARLGKITLIADQESQIQNWKSICID